MIIQSYSNKGSTTLNNGGTLTSGATTVTVTDATVFPAVTTGVSAFDLILESEIIRCTNVSGNVLTILRGQEGTSAVSHADGLAINEIVTAQGIKNFGSIVHASDIQANRPTPGNVGRLWLPTDGQRLELEDGTNWSAWGPLFPFVEPNDALYSWVNQGSATVSTTNGGIYLSIPANASTKIAARIKAIPAAPYSVIMACLPMVVQSDFVDCGMFLENSGTGNLITFGIAANSFISSFEVITVVKYTSPTTSGTAYTTSPATIVAPTWQVGPCMWFKIADDNTNRTYALSNDGVNFTPILSTARTDFITPDKIGFYVHVSNASFGSGLNVLSFTGG